ncbi:MAG TPA: hypothetical protein VD995_02260 [Azospirillum sp.]|nr:hypothetical protein [Azospirillum sp.]
MRTLFRPIIAGLMLAGFVSAGPALAADPPAATPPPPPPAVQPATPGEQAKMGLELLMKALEGWIRQFPAYAAPEFTPDGDIIIRRLDKNRPATPDPQSVPAPGGAPT